MDKNQEPYYIEHYLNSVEAVNNGPSGGEEFVHDRSYYLHHLLQQNFIPTEETVQLYRTYMSGKQDSWWCKASMTFREFVNTIREADKRETRYKKDYRRGFADGVRFILMTLSD